MNFVNELDRFDFDLQLSMECRFDCLLNFVVNRLVVFFDFVLRHSKENFVSFQRTNIVLIDIWHTFDEHHDQLNIDHRLLNIEFHSKQIQINFKINFSSKTNQILIGISSKESFTRCTRQNIVVIANSSIIANSTDHFVRFFTRFCWFIFVDLRIIESSFIQLIVC